MNIHKGYLQKVATGANKKLQWVVSTTRKRAVSIFGQEAVPGMAYSAYDSSKPKTGTGIAHTAYLGESYTDEQAQWMTDTNGGSDEFYLDVPNDAKQPIVVLTLQMYADLQKTNATANASEQEPTPVFAD